MCRRVLCEACGKPGFKGCGAHVEQVLGDVPRAERCRCHEAKGQVDAGPSASGSWLDRIRGAINR